MNEKSYVFTRMCMIQQLASLLFTGGILATEIGTLFFDRSFWNCALAIIFGTLMVAINLLVSTLYRVQKNGRDIIIQNIWRRKTCPIGELTDIRPVKFVIPYPFNPYVKFSFSGGRFFIGRIPNILFVHLRGGGVRTYLEDVREAWSR